MLNLSAILESSASKNSSLTAFSIEDTYFTFGQVNDAANQVANGLVKLGIVRGDKVALSCLNLPYFPIIYFGILKAGATVVPLSILLKKDEIAYHLTDSEVKAYFCYTGNDVLPMAKMGYAGFKEASECEHFILIAPALSDSTTIPGIATLGELMAEESINFETVLTNEEDTAVIIYTSGTTGKPKGAELTHSNLLLNAILCTDLISTTKEDIQLIVLPLFHIFAMTFLMNGGIYRGCHSIMMTRFDARAVLRKFQEKKVSVFAGVPTMYWALLNYSDADFDNTTISKYLRICVSGGASLPLNVLHEFTGKFNVPLIEGYGMSEGSPVITFNQLDVGCKPGSIGTEAWGVQVKLVDENDNEVAIGEKGELVYRGHNVMKGYYKREKASAETLRGGWMHSGDIATKDEDGFYFIVDRTKDMIIRGGLNVYPREIEEVMMSHEAISLVAVIGIPDDKMGEEIKAFVVLKESQSVVPQNIIKWTRSKVASYKYPRVVEIVDNLPMSATGKILKKELRKLND